MSGPDVPAATTAPVARSWTLRRRLGGAFGALVVVGALLVAAVIASTALFVHAGNQVIYRWQPAISSSQRLLTDTVDQETGVRGYVLSGRASFLGPYRGALADQQRDAERVRNLIGDDRPLQIRLTALLDATRRWQRTVAEPAVAAVAAGRSDVASLVDGASARAAFDEIRSTAAAFSSQLAARARAARDDRTADGYVFVVALALALIVLVLAGLSLWRGLNRWILAPVDRLGGQVRVVAAGETHRRIEPDGPSELTDLAGDVEAMRLQIATQLALAEQIQDELRQTASDLARSNDDLQQFAYVASHDLSEPLRKVANFCQLLERQYGEQLDDRAKQYIAFAVDGAKRMQVLITDLLALSRVGRTTERFVPVDLDAALDQAVRNLGDRVTDPGARIERHGALPTVPGDRSLLTSLLENLVGNAVKYRREDVAPVVRVDAMLDPVARDWVFTVSDNGIGIDHQYAERIFAVFQRLHLRDEYGGTGIGLALCRRIVEFHGGEIALTDVESAHGATFRFTLPAGEVAGER